MLLYLMAAFSLFYMRAVFVPKPDHAGIWRVWSADREKDAPGRADKRVETSGYGMLAWGLYFSVLSAFHIGWRDLNVGTWIMRISPQEYSLRATGWVKTVSGVQSLISIYLIALWAWTYFGAPFA